MFTNKYILVSLSLLTYCTIGYAMEIEPFGARKQLPSFQLLSHIAAPDYQPSKEDEQQLVSIYAPFAKNERAKEELPKMILAASAYWTLFDAPKEDKVTTMNDITDMVEIAENFYHAQCTPDKKELDEKDKQQVAEYLHFSPFIYRNANSTLFGQTQSKTPLRRQFDEFAARQVIVEKHLASLESLTKTLHTQTSSMPQGLQTQVKAHVTVDELQTSLKLAKKLLELNKTKAIERMKNVNSAQKTAVERCKSVVATFQEDLKKAPEETKAEISAELETAKKQLTDEEAHSKTLQAELDEASNISWYTYIGKAFSFSGH